jgi:hypothetical protein
MKDSTKRLLTGGAIATTAVIVIGGTATAASQITAHELATGAANHRVIEDGSVHRSDLTDNIVGSLGDIATQQGEIDTITAAGTALQQGVKQLGQGQQQLGAAVAGLKTLNGAYYSIAKYDVGDTNGGAVATVACSGANDVAISGGVRTLALGDNGLNGNVPVSSSFPGRMDWSTNSPKADRLDGWIVQFGTQTGSAPKYADVYALCVPGAGITSKTTYTESAN